MKLELPFDYKPSTYYCATLFYVLFTGSKREHARNGCLVCDFDCKNSISNTQPCTCTWHKEMEKRKAKDADEYIVKMANEVSNFPDENVIAEFQKQLLCNEPSDPRVPCLSRAAQLVSEKLDWSLNYAVEKILPLLTHWILTHTLDATDCMEVTALR